MSNWYKSSDGKIGKIKTIKNVINGEEEINGKYGFIWNFSSTHARACITSIRIIKKYVTKECQTGDEAVITFHKDELNKWIKILKVGTSRKLMIKRADSFGKESI